MIHASAALLVHHDVTDLALKGNRAEQLSLHIFGANHTHFGLHNLDNFEAMPIHVVQFLIFHPFGFVL